MRDRAIAVTSLSTGNLFAVFGCGAGSHELLCKIWDGTQPAGEQWLPSQEAWTNLGGSFDSTVAPVIEGGLFPPWPLDLFGLGSNYGMYSGIMSVSTPLAPPPPVGWSSIGGTFNGPPAATQYGAGGALYAPGMNRIVVGLGTDNQPYASSYSAITQEFSDWLPLGGVLISELAYDNSGPDYNKFAILRSGRRCPVVPARYRRDKLAAHSIGLGSARRLLQGVAGGGKLGSWSTRCVRARNQSRNVPSGVG